MSFYNSYGYIGFDSNGNINLSVADQSFSEGTVSGNQAYDFKWKSQDTNFEWIHPSGGAYWFLDLDSDYSSYGSWYLSYNYTDENSVVHEKRIYFSDPSAQLGDMTMLHFEDGVLVTQTPETFMFAKGPIGEVKFGYYPVFSSQSGALSGRPSIPGLSSGATSAELIYDGGHVQYWMPEGGQVGVDRLEGDGNRATEHLFDDGANPNLGFNYYNEDPASVEANSNFAISYVGGRGSAELSGSDTAISIAVPFPGDEAAETDFSFSFWFRKAGLPEGQNHELNQVVFDATSSSGDGFGIYFDRTENNNRLTLGVTEGGNFSQISPPEAQIIDDVWYHVFISFNRAYDSYNQQSMVSVYMNGNFVFQMPIASNFNLDQSVIYGASRNPSFGATGEPEFINNFKGSFDTIRSYYNTEFNDREPESNVRYAEEWVLDPTLPTPTISLSPDPVNTALGESVSASVHADFGELRFTGWQKSADNGVTWENIPWLTTAVDSYNIFNDFGILAPFSNLKIRAYATVDFQTVYSQEFQLGDFNYNPQIIIDQAAAIANDPASFNPGDSLTLTANSSGGYATNIYWEIYNAESDYWSTMLAAYISDQSNITIGPLEINIYLGNQQVRARMTIDGGEDVVSETLTLPDFAANLTPMSVFGYYPLFNTSDEAKVWGNVTTAHSHELNGTTYWMPDGLTMGVNQFHGDHGIYAKLSFDDTLSGSGLSEWQSSTIDSVANFGSDAGRTFLQLTGTSKYVYTDLHSGLFDAENPSNPFTISFWIKPASGNQEGDVVFSTSRIDQDGGFYFRKGPDNAYAFVGERGDLNGNTSYAGSSSIWNGFTLPDEEWSHVTIVMQSNHVALRYLNGQYIGTTNLSGGTPINNHSPFTFGGLVSNEDHLWEGGIDDFRIWTNKLMSAEEVLYHYEQSIVVDMSDLVNVTLSMSDSYGDGWNGNILYISDEPISVTENPFSTSTAGQFYQDVNGDAIALLSGGSGSTQVHLPMYEDDGVTPRQYFWVLGGGSYLYEAGFTLTNASNGMTLVEHSAASGSTYFSGSFNADGSAIGEGGGDGYTEEPGGGGGESPQPSNSIAFTNGSFSVSPSGYQDWPSAENIWLTISNPDNSGTLWMLQGYDGLNADFETVISPQNMDPNTYSETVSISSLAMGANWPSYDYVQFWVMNPVSMEWTNALTVSDTSGEGGGDGYTEEPGESGFANFTPFSGAVRVGDEYTFPSGADVWAGFANVNSSLNPFGFPYGGEISFNASSAAPVSLRFKFEANPYPLTEPSFYTDSVSVDGETQAYTVQIPAQDVANTYNSFILYLTTMDQGVTITDVSVTEFADPNEEEIPPAGEGGAGGSGYPIDVEEGDKVMIFADGILLHPTQYSISGGMITFVSDPPSGTVITGVKSK